MARRGPPGGGPDFGQLVPHDGYAWWYVDAFSDDGDAGVTVIAFVGSVFSPYYAFERRRGPTDPENHVAINAALYGRGGHRWVMTERNRPALSRAEEMLLVGPSMLVWDGTSLTIVLDEIAVPFPARVKGRIRVFPAAVTSDAFVIDGQGEHLWRPIAPVSRVEVEFEKPSLSWSGHGYFDWNSGTRPLERDFESWDWSRSPLSGGTAVLYDVRRRDGGGGTLAVGIDRRGNVGRFDPPPPVALPRTRIWRVARGTASEESGETGVVATLEDTPFYARSVVSQTIGGETVNAMHESLSLRRFRNPVVQMMLPFRMPRRRL